MPRNIRTLLKELRNAGFVQLQNRGKGSHRLFYHPKCINVVTISGKDSDDAKHYQEKQVKNAIEGIKNS